MLECAENYLLLGTIWTRKVAHLFAETESRESGWRGSGDIHPGARASRRAIMSENLSAFDDSSCIRPASHQLRRHLRRNPKQQSIAESIILKQVD